MRRSRKLKQVACIFALFLFVEVGARAQNFGVSISTASSEEQSEQVEKDKFELSEKIPIKISVKNMGDTKANVPKGEDWYRPRLYRNGRLLPYRQEVSERIEKGERGEGSFRVTGFLFLEPNQLRVDMIDLSYWYPPLEAGQYQLSLERLFFKRERIESNVVFFEVVPEQQ